jgi:nucleoid-associated protein YejK
MPVGLIGAVKNYIWEVKKMSEDFIFKVEKVALHLVDRDLDSPRFSKQVIELAAIDSKEDIEALDNFFSGHLKDIWKSVEASRTRAVKFTKDSQVKSFYQTLNKDPSKFFQLSKDMAKLLFKVSKSRATTSGLLMVLWFRKVGIRRKFLALLKLDPGPSDKITLRQDEEKDVLLGLAVRHIEQALPDPGAQVLKWTVVPHPTRPAFHAKVKDKEGKGVARYFVDFIGCVVKPNEKEQIVSLLEFLPTYIKKHHPDIDDKIAVNDLIFQLEQTGIITPEVTAEEMNDMEVFKDFKKQVFLKELKKSSAAELYISSRVLRATKIQYQLPGNIIIKGPRAVMEGLLDITNINGDKKICIRTSRFDETEDKSYVW